MASSSKSGPAVSLEYKQWKRNVPYLYDMLMMHSLEWPSLVAQWLPYVSEEEGEDRSVHRVILGTHTTGEQNQLLIAAVQLPNEETQFQNMSLNPDEPCLESIGKVDIDIRINHDGEVNCARYMPQNTRLIATLTKTGDVLIFNYLKRSNHRSGEGRSCRPELRLRSHTQDGFGLEWNPLMAGLLLSGANDRTICLWDINAPTKKHRVIHAMHTFYGHSGVVQDVSWHHFNEAVFGSVGDDKKLLIWDTRMPDISKPVHSVDAHKGTVNCLSFNSFSDFMLATGSDDQSIAIWDLRNLKLKVHTLKAKEEEYYQVEWSPLDKTTLASSGSGNFLHIWDLSKINELQTARELKDGPPELLFVHGGHNAPISEFSWSLNEPWLLCSAAADNVLQIWQMGEHIWNAQGAPLRDARQNTV